MADTLYGQVHVRGAFILQYTSGLMPRVFFAFAHGYAV